LAVRSWDSYQQPSTPFSPPTSDIRDLPPQNKGTSSRRIVGGGSQVGGGSGSGSRGLGGGEIKDNNPKPLPEVKNPTKIRPDLVGKIDIKTTSKQNGRYVTRRTIYDSTGRGVGEVITNKGVSTGANPATSRVNWYEGSSSGTVNYQGKELNLRRTNSGTAYSSSGETGIIPKSGAYIGSLESYTARTGSGLSDARYDAWYKEVGGVTIEEGGTGRSELNKLREAARTTEGDNVLVRMSRDMRSDVNDYSKRTNVSSDNAMLSPVSTKNKIVGGIVGGLGAAWAIGGNVVGGFASNAGGIYWGAEKWLSEKDVGGRAYFEGFAWGGEKIRQAGVFMYKKSQDRNLLSVFDTPNTVYDEYGNRKNDRNRPATVLLEGSGKTIEFIGGGIRSKAEQAQNQPLKTMADVAITAQTFGGGIWKAGGSIPKNLASAGSKYYVGQEVIGSTFVDTAKYSLTPEQQKLFGSDVTRQARQAGYVAEQDYLSGQKGFGSKVRSILYSDTVYVGTEGSRKARTEGQRKELERLGYSQSEISNIMPVVQAETRGKGQQELIGVFSASVAGEGFGRGMATRLLKKNALGTATGSAVLSRSFKLGYRAAAPAGALESSFITYTQGEGRAYKPTTINYITNAALGSGTAGFASGTLNALYSPVPVRGSKVRRIKYSDAVYIGTEGSRSFKLDYRAAAPAGALESSFITYTQGEGRAYKPTTINYIKNAALGSGTAGFASGTLNALYSPKVRKGIATTLEYPVLSVFDPIEKPADFAEDLFSSAARSKYGRRVITPTYTVSFSENAAKFSLPTQTSSKTKTSTRNRNRVSNRNNPFVNTNTRTNTNIFTNIFTNTNVNSNILSDTTTNTNTNINTNTNANIFADTTTNTNTNTNTNTQTRVTVVTPNIKGLPPFLMPRRKGKKGKSRGGEVVEIFSKDVTSSLFDIKGTGSLKLGRMGMAR
jgi:hypothetical protein